MEAVPQFCNVCGNKLVPHGEETREVKYDMHTGERDTCVTRSGVVPKKGCV